MRGGTIFHLFNIIHFSSTCCTRISVCKAAHNGEEDSKSKRRGKRVVSKSRPAVIEYFFLFLCRQVPVPPSSPIASKSPGTTGASGRLGSRMNIAASSFDAASASQVQIMYTEYTQSVHDVQHSLLSISRLYDGGENQRNLFTVAALHTECG